MKIKIRSMPVLWFLILKASNYVSCVDDFPMD